MKNLTKSFLGCLGIMCGLSLPASAAPITWTSGPTPTVDQNSIALNGTLVHAGSWGTGALSVAVGSENILFADAPVGAALGANNSVVTANGEALQADVWAPPGAVAANFHSVMDGFAYDGANPKTLVLGGLEVSATYQVQIFVSDDRSCCSGRTQKWSDSATNGTGNETAVFTHGSSSYVIGTFIANASTQTIYGHGVAQTQNGINAYVLRKIADVQDSDGDGMPDVYEALYAFLNSADPADGVLDFDGDGLSNSLEFANGSRPDVADTDEDGLSDGDEVLVHQTSPVRADTDGDGLTDFNEVTVHLTNPRSTDSDGDNFPDNWEITAASNPNLATSTPNGTQVTFLGTGTAALIGGDLTDPENDGSDATSAGTGFNWTSVSSTTRPYFSAPGGTPSEGGLDVFDNKVGGGEAKFCCDGGVWSITVEFPEFVSLTHFTITSSNDAPERDPRVWEIQGSNDGLSFVNLTRFDWPAAPIWTSRDQVMRVDLPSASFPYRYIRYRVLSSGSTLNALGELEFFGEMSGADADGDGLPKLFEDRFAFLSDSDPADAALDFDGDGLTNLDEYTLSTSLEIADTDGDGLSDGDEVNVHFTNPVIVDSDGDGLSDGDEVNEHQTDPTKQDSDDDYYRDGYEVSKGSDPADPLSAPDGVVVSSLGTGTSALLGGDLTDRDNDGVESATPNASGFDWLTITSSSNSWFHGFGGNEGAFDVFDNKVGGGEAKWCCGTAPQTLTVEFEFPVRLTHFTVTSGNDSPERDPRAWAILGSNDGVTFTPIFQMSDVGAPFWTLRDEVMRFTLDAPAAEYKFIRYSVTATNSTMHQLAEIEYFGLELDSDGDGIPDSYEDRFAFLDKNNPADAALDTDSDGLTNLEEYTAGTRMDLVDTDGDGLSDTNEIQLHLTDPTNRDSDGDLVADGAEIDLGSDPKDQESLPAFNPVVWGEAQDITGDLSDFATDGYVVHAWTGGATAVPVAGLGVTFQPGQSLGNRFTGYDPYNRGGDADYETLLNSGSWSGGSGFLEIPDLEVGGEYQIQVWVADTRVGTSNRTWTFDAFDLTSPFVQLDSGAQGDETNFPGQYAVGTFTADYKTQFIYVSSVYGAQYNMVMVRRLDGDPPVSGPLTVVSQGFAGGAYEITVSGFNTTKSYVLTRSLDLASPFVTVGAAFSPTSATFKVSDPAPPAGRAFYRVMEAP